LPLTLGAASAPRATPELLFTPFFLTPSVGGGIDEGIGVPVAPGVLEVESDGLSPLELVAMGRVFEVVDEDSFEGDSSLTMVSANLLSSSGDSFNLTRPGRGLLAGLVDFRRGTVGVVAADVGLFAEAIMKDCDDERGM